MNYEFLTSQYGFSNTSQDGALSVGSKTSARKTDIVFTERSKAGEADQSFADYLKSQKDRADKSDKKDDFKTQQDRGVSKLRDEKIETSDDEYILNLTALGQHLRALIDTVNEQDNDQQNDAALIEIDAILESDAAAFDKISDLLGVFNAQDENGAPLSNEDQIASLLRLVDMLSAEQATLSGLSLEEITTLQEQVQKLLSETLEQDEIDALNAVVAQFVTLAAPPSERREDAAPRAEIKLGIKDSPAPLQNQATPSDRSTQNHSDARYDSRFDISARADLSRGSATEDHGFDQTLKSASQAKAEGQTATTKAATTTQSAAERFLSSASFMNAFGSFGGTSESTLLSPTYAQQSSTALSSSLTNVITQAQSASQPHPATQAVSLTMSKAVKGGEKTDIKLHLNPPELGRVDVKMSIDKDSKAKIVLTVEKPETYLMLQRDADVLQRALSDAGLDSQGDIAFELAGDQQNTHSGRGGENSDGNGARNDAGEDPNLIETTMDWHVDPESGHMRYSLLV